MPTSLQFVIRSTLALLAIGFTALLFVVLATVWLSVRAQMHLRDVEAARELRRAATLLHSSLLAAESSQRGYLLTGNEIYLAPYDNAKSVTLGEVERLKTLMASDVERRPLLTALSRVVTEKIKEQDEIIALKVDNRSQQAVDIINSNRGKALMDEANVYLAAITLEADERLTARVEEQTSNTTWLRWSSAASALVIIAVVSGVLTTLHRYTGEITAARDEVRRTNESLEMRVAQRTQELSRARDRAEVLLAEVNHRVANSLALVSSLVRLQARQIDQPAAQEVLKETDARIQAIAQMHKHLFTTGSVGEVAADTYLGAVLTQLEAATAASGSGVAIKWNIASIAVATNDAVNLGIIITEWVTNAVKYAYPGGRGEVRVRLDRSEANYEVTVEDDGVGRKTGDQFKGTGLGTRVVNAIAALLRAEVHYRDRNPGTEAVLLLPLPSKGEGSAAE